MTLTGPDVRILQVHPTRFCNLRCLHCYSSSGPEERGELGVPLLERAIREAASLGYNVLSVSGGEPTLYSGVRRLCLAAREHGMIATLVSNGTTLNQRRVAELEGAVDAVAISIDGRPERHNDIRRAPRAFEQMEERLELLRQAGIPFGIVYTLTRENLCDLEWAAGFAVAQGAVLLQVHPIEQYGRACTDMSDQDLPDRETLSAWVLVECLREIHRHELVIHFDALSRYSLPVEPDEVQGWKADLYSGLRSLGEIVSPLVIEDDGSVVPLRYGFPRSFQFGNLREISLAEMSLTWVHNQADAFCSLYRDVLEQISGCDNMFSNVYELLAERATALDRTPLVSIA